MENEDFSAKTHFQHYHDTIRSTVITKSRKTIEDVLSICNNEYGIESSYDIGWLPRIDLLSITELWPTAGYVYLHPVNIHLAYTILRLGVLDSQHEREINIDPQFDRYVGPSVRVPKYHKVFFLPGTNLMSKYFGDQDRLIDYLTAGWYFKLHPLTHDRDVDFLEKLLGDKLIGPGISASSIFHNTDKIGTCPNSELGMYAALFDKQQTVHALYSDYAPYTNFYSLMSETKEPKKILQRIAGNPMSGVFNVNDPDVLDQVRKYVEEVLIDLYAII